MVYKWDENAFLNQIWFYYLINEVWNAKLIFFQIFLENFRILSKQHEITDNIELKIKNFIQYCKYELKDIIKHYQTDQTINQSYPVEQDSPVTGHIEITSNIKRHTNVKRIVFQ